MADDTSLGVDLAVGSNDLEVSLRRTFEALSAGLQSAQNLQRFFENTAARARELPGHIADLGRQIEAATKSSNSDLVKRLNEQLKASIENQKKFNDELREEARLQKEIGLARGAGNRARLAAPVGTPDGRTVDQARATEKALSDAVSGINTTAAQIEARIALATGKAMERMLTSTANAIERSYAIAEQRQRSRAAQLSVPGYLEARVTNDRVAAELSVEKAQTGGTLADRRARADRVKRLEQDAAEAAAKERAYQLQLQSYRAGEIRQGLRADAREADPQTAVREAGTNRTFSKRYGVDYDEYARQSDGMSPADRRSVLKGMQAQADAAREKAKRDADAEKLTTSLRNQDIRGQQRAAARDADPRTAAIEEGRSRSFFKRYGVDYDVYAQQTQGMSTKERGELLARYRQQVEEGIRAGKDEATARRSVADAARQDASATDAFSKLKEGYRAQEIRANQRSGVRELDPGTAIRDQRSNAAFNRRYGISRDDYERETDGMGRRDRISYLDGVEQRQNLTRQQARPDTQARVQGQIDNRNAIMSSGGGRDMLGFQAQLATNYAIFGLITSAITGSAAAIVDFDNKLKQFQAITETSNSEMGKFRANLLGVAADSRFSVSELTQTAIALGQTGLAADGVTKALRPVANLAAASGSTLQQSVEAITGVLGAYNMEASRAGEVADVFVAALNRTKLTMDQLQLGIQYAANIARDSGVSFTELTASIGAIAQAGVRSGSTIGTGMRQLITDLASPSEKLRGVLKELGITLEEVDLRTQGFTGVLENLKAKGFGTTEALRSLELRAAAAFSALVGQSDKIKLLEQEFLLTSAATEASAKANESFSASGQRLINVIFGLVDKGFGPLVQVLAASTGGFANLLTNLNSLGPVLPLIAAGLTAIAGAAAAIKLTNLLAGTSLLAGTATLPIAGALAVGGGIAYYLTTLQSEADKAREKLDALKGVENTLIARQSSLQTTSSELDKTITSLIDRKDKLNNDPILRQNAIISAQKAFGDLGLSVDLGSKSIDGLISALQRLRGDLSQEMPQAFVQQLVVIGQKIAELQKLQIFDEQRNKSQVRAIGPGVGGPFGVPTLASSDRLGWMRELGPQFSTAADFLTGQNKIDPLDPRRSTAGPQLDMYNELKNLQNALTVVRLDTSLKDGDGNTAAKKLEERIDLVNRALTLFGDRVASVTNQQALAIQREVTERNLQRDTIRALPAYDAMKRGADDLYGKQQSAVLAAAKEPDDLAKYERMQTARKSTDDAVRAQLAQLDQLEKELLADPKLEKGVKEALSEVRESLLRLLKGSSDLVRNRFDAEKPAIQAALQQQIRTRETELALLQKQATTSRDPEKAREYEAQALIAQNEINSIRERLFRVDLGSDPDTQIEKSGEVKARLKSLQEQGREKIDALAITYSEIHRKLQEQLLTYQIQGATDRKGLIETQIKGLEKVRDDVRSTPEAMRAAVLEINRLLGEVAKIGQGINSLNADKNALTVPQGAIPPSVNFTAGSAQQTVVDKLKEAGASEEMIRYAITMGQIESRYAPDVISGARKSSAGATGIFQFMPGTWKGLTGEGSVNTDIGAQSVQMKRFTDQNTAQFRAAMGREPTPEEMYLMHQQGAEGALKLLRAGSAPASGVVGLSAVTGNGGRADMSSEDFISLWARKYRSAAAEVGNPFGTTGDVEVKRRQQQSNDKIEDERDNARRDNDAKEAAANRARELARLKKLDQAESENYSGQTAAIRRALTPDEAIRANSAATASLKKLFDLATQQDANKPRGEGDEGREEGREARRKQFSASAQDQAISAADAVGKAVMKRYQDEIDRREAEKKELERPENSAKPGNTDRLNVLNQEIEALTQQKNLKGETEAITQKIALLEQSLKDITSSGMGTAEQQLRIQERLTELKQRQALIEPQTKIVATQAATSNTLGGALQGGVDDFLKSRGVLDMKGMVVNPVIEARKLLAENLSAIGSSFDNLWKNLFSGTMKAGDALKKFATDILGSFMTSISKSLTNDIIRSLFTSGEKGGGSGGLFGGLVDAITGGATKASNGGPLRRAGGGGIPYGSAATAFRDSQMVLAEPGEYMLRKSAVDAIGRDSLDQMNALGSAMVNRAPKIEPEKRFGGARAESNVYVVDRDQVPVPSRDDIVHHIGDNIQRGGAIKTLIRQVAAGHG